MRLPARSPQVIPQRLASRSRNGHRRAPARVLEAVPSARIVGIERGEDMLTVAGNDSGIGSPPRPLTF